MLYTTGPGLIIEIPDLEDRVIGVRWLVNKDTGAWVLQYCNEHGDWAKVPVIFEGEEDGK